MGGELKVDRPLSDIYNIQPVKENVRLIPVYNCKGVGGESFLHVVSSFANAKFSNLLYILRSCICMFSKVRIRGAL